MTRGYIAIGEIKDARDYINKAIMILSVEELPDREAVGMILDRLTDASNELTSAEEKIGLTGFT